MLVHGNTLHSRGTPSLPRVPLLLFQLVCHCPGHTTLTRLPLCLSGAHSRTFPFLFFTIWCTLTHPHSLCSHQHTLTVSSLVIRHTLTDPSSFVNCSPFVHRLVAGLLPLFRRLFHQLVAGLLSCSLLLTASSQLKPFVFCIAVCSPVGLRTVVFLLYRRLFTGRLPDCHLFFVISSNARDTLNGPVVAVACL